MPDKLFDTPENLQSHPPSNQNIEPDNQNNNQFTDISETEQIPLSVDTMPADNSHGLQTKELMKQYEAGEIGIEKLMAVCEKGLGRMSVAAAEKIVGIEIENEKKPDKGLTAAEMLAKRQADRAALKKTEEVTKSPKEPQTKKSDKPLSEKLDANKIIVNKAQPEINDLADAIIHELEIPKHKIKNNPPDLADDLAEVAGINQHIPPESIKKVKTKDSSSSTTLHSPPVSSLKAPKIISSGENPNRLLKADITGGKDDEVAEPIYHKDLDKDRIARADLSISTLVTDSLPLESLFEENDVNFYDSINDNPSEIMSVTEKITYFTNDGENSQTDIADSPVLFENDNFTNLNTNLITFPDLYQPVVQRPILNLNVETICDEMFEFTDTRTIIMNCLPNTLDIVEPANQQIIDRFSMLITDKIVEFKQSFSSNESIETNETNLTELIDQIQTECADLFIALKLPINDEAINKLLKMLMPLSNEGNVDLPSWSERIFTDSEGDHERLPRGLLITNPVNNIIHGFIGRLALGFKSAA